MEEQFLRACPFCGTIPEIVKTRLRIHSRTQEEFFKFWISCQNCGCTIDMHETDTIDRDEETARRNAINKWNTRHERH